MKNKQILIVEDEPIISLNLKERLLLNGYDVPAVTNTGEKAVELARELTPDLILMDIKLAGKMDGITAIQNIIPFHDVPFIYITAHSDKETIDKLKITEPYGYIQKPIKNTELISAIEIAFYKYKMDRKLADSEKKYRQLVELAQEGIWVLDNNLFTTFVNPSICDMLGYSAEEMIGMPINSLIRENDVPRLAEYFNKNQNEKNQDLQLIHKNGNTVYTVIASRPIIDDDRNNKGFLAGLIDITQSKQSEKQLKILSQAMEQSPSTVIITDNEGIIEYVNPQFTRLTGYSPDEIIGKSQGVLKPDISSYEEMYFEFWETIKTGEKWHGEFLNRKKNGEIFWEAVSISPIKNDSGEIKHIIKVSEDITQKKNLENLIAVSERNLKALINAMTESVLLIDLNGKVIIINETTSKRLETRTEELIGKCIYDFLPQNIADFRKKKADDVIRTKKPIQFEDERFGRHIFNSIYPVFDDIGNLAALAVFGFDVTEQKKAEEKHRISEEKYKNLFENSPISLWEVDLSEISKYFIELKNKGISDIRIFFDENPMEIDKCISMMKISDVNLVTLNIYHAKNKESFINNFKNILTKETIQIFKEAIIYLFNGNTEFETKALTKDFNGDNINILVRLSVSPGYEKNLEKVLISVIDITELEKYQERIKLLTKKIITAQEEERQRLSKDLHDGVIQKILAAKINLKEYLNDTAGSNERLIKGIEFIDQVNSELREICYNLYPSILNDIGLTSAIHWYARNTLEISGISNDIDINIGENLTNDLKINIFRMIQEIFSNIIKHSNANTVNIKLDYTGDNCIQLQVQDNGEGLPMEILSSEQNIKYNMGMGLSNLKQRTELFGGTFNIISSPGSGTKTNIIIPLEDADEEDKNISG